MFEIRVLMAHGKKPSITMTEDKALAKILINAARNTGCPVLVLQDGKIVRQYNNARIAENEVFVVQYCDTNMRWHQKGSSFFLKEVMLVMGMIQRKGLYGRAIKANTSVDEIAKTFNDKKNPPSSDNPIFVDGEILHEVNKELKQLCCRTAPRLPAPSRDLPVKTRRTTIERDGADPILLEEVHYTSGREAWFISMPEDGLGFNEIKPSAAKFWLKEARQNKEIRAKNESWSVTMAVELQREAEEAYATVVEAMPEEGGAAHKLIRTINE